MSEVRGSGRECQAATRRNGREGLPRVRGQRWRLGEAVTVWAQEGLEELSHIEGQERRR